jgi:hypothetical protein
MAETHDPIALELFKNAIFSIADEMALTVFRTTHSGVLGRGLPLIGFHLTPGARLLGAVARGGA